MRSKPADGAELEALPKRVSLTFAKAVPLDTIQVVLVQSSGARVDAKGFRHGPGGEQEVIVPLGRVEPGALTLRWRLVNSDGHVVSGRVRLAVPAPPDTGAASSDEAEAAPPATSAPPAQTEPPVQDEAVFADADDGTWSTPDPLRWFLRVASFLGMVVVVGSLDHGLAGVAGRRRAVAAAWLGHRSLRSWSRSPARCSSCCWRRT